MAAKLWIVRAGRNQQFLDRFLDENSAIVGLDPSIGAEALALDRDQLVTRVLEVRPGWSKHRAGSRGGQTFRFLHELAEGDEVATYDPSTRNYYLGVIEGGPEALEGGLFRRPVDWRQRVARDTLSVQAKNSLGAIMTVFQPSDIAVNELRAKAVAIDAEDDAGPALVPPTEGDADEAAESVEALQEQASNAIDDRLAGLDPYEMQDLVAGVLRAMGFQTQVSPKGSDRGVDIFASPDGLGLEEPRIFVEVKHRIRTAMGSQEVRGFLGGRQPGDRCLFVSTGGFTREARYEADRSNVPLTLVDLPRLRDLLLEHYEAMDLSAQRLVPLTWVAWPADS